MDLFKGLNPPQLEAVNHLEGPLLVMAGAGSGKTRVLTCRIANLIRHGVSPRNILAITFTNKAAGEMLERVNNLVGSVASNICFTFHSFCARLLRREIDALDIYGKNFTIYDASDSLALVKACVKEENLDSKQYSGNAVRAHISDAKNKLITAEEFAKGKTENYDKNIANIYSRYQRKLVENNALDFDDLLLVTVKLLTKHAEIREKYQERFKYILVDEYQDTNGAQYQITKLLAAKYKNLCVVGDADQSIYGWRGADMRNILDFNQDYPEAKVVKLEENYRSYGYILDAANALIKNNIDRHPKKLWTEKPKGEKITYYTAVDAKDEADYVVSTIKENKRSGVFGYSDTAVLYRTNAQSRVLEDACLTRGLPYVMVGAFKFYERKEIKDIMAYLRVLLNPLDDVSLLRIINVPKRSIGSTTISRIGEFAAEREISFFDVISDEEILAEVEGLKKAARNKLENFVEFIFGLMGVYTKLPLDRLVERVLTESGYWEELEADKVEGPGRLDNLKEFIGIAKEFSESEENPTLDDFLSHLALITDLDTADLESDRVTLMTFHAAKGLEFPAVFMIGMEDGLFPHSRTLMDLSELEEERRTCYVGITRAQKKLYLTNAEMRMIYGSYEENEPSRFIGELPEECLEREGLARRVGRSVERRDDHKFGASRHDFGGAKRGAIFSGSPPSGLKAWEQVKRSESPKKTLKSPENLLKPDMSVEWSVGEKACHAKWGEGTVVQVKGTGEDTEITIAFPDNGVKTMAQKYAPIVKVKGDTV